MTLDLNEQQLSYVMQVLAQRPYGEVADLIGTIHRQATEQMQMQTQRPHLVPNGAAVPPMQDEHFGPAQ